MRIILRRCSFSDPFDKPRFLENDFVRVFRKQRHARRVRFLRRSRLVALGSVEVSVKR